MRPNQNCGGSGMMPCGGRPPMPAGYPNGALGPVRPPINSGCQTNPNGSCGGPPPMPMRPPRMFDMQAESRGYDRERFPVGMGYVPMQCWETPYPMAQGFQRGTIFPSLDYPFMMGRCRR